MVRSLELDGEGRAAGVGYNGQIWIVALIAIKNNTSFNFSFHFHGISPSLLIPSLRLGSKGRL